ncbi:MAG: hypothetical protein Ta2D_10960 [Rickettsiales bacterium]|nr:MAG: hypothetical protein Ta2D_10960 [Rickettsiales bacterium]
MLFFFFAINISPSYSNTCPNPIGAYPTATGNYCQNCASGNANFPGQACSSAKCGCNTCQNGTNAFWINQYNYGNNSDVVKLYTCTPTCPANQITPQGRNGYYDDWKLTCSDCPTGCNTNSQVNKTFCGFSNPGYSITANNTCNECPSGTYSVGGAVGTTCTTCAIGTYSSAGASSCTSCSQTIGTFYTASNDCTPTSLCSNAIPSQEYTLAFTTSNNCPTQTCPIPPVGKKYDVAGSCSSVANCTNALIGQEYDTDTSVANNCPVKSCDATTGSYYTTAGDCSTTLPCTNAISGETYTSNVSTSNNCPVVSYTCPVAPGVFYPTSSCSSPSTCTTNQNPGHKYDSAFVVTNSCPTSQCPDTTGTYYNGFAGASVSYNCSATSILSPCTNAIIGQQYISGFATTPTGCPTSPCSNTTGTYYTTANNCTATSPCTNALAGTCYDTNTLTTSNSCPVSPCTNSLTAGYYYDAAPTPTTACNSCSTAQCPYTIDNIGYYYDSPALNLADCSNHLRSCTGLADGEYFDTSTITFTTTDNCAKLNCSSVITNSHYTSNGGKTDSCLYECDATYTGIDNSGNVMYDSPNVCVATISNCSLYDFANSNATSSICNKCSNGYHATDTGGTSGTSCELDIPHCSNYDPSDLTKCLLCESSHSTSSDKTSCEEIKLSSQTKSLAEGIITNLISLQQATNLIASDGIDRALQSLNYESLITKDELKKLKDTNIKSSAVNSTSNYKQYALYSAVNGGFSRYNTGSHINTISYNALMGIAFRDAFNMPNLLLSVFANWGNSSYTAFNDDITATGDTTNFGGGILAHYKYAPDFLINNLNNINNNTNNTNKYSSWLYTELSFSGGIVKNSYKPDKMYQILITGSRGEQDTSYNFQTNYMTGHIGQGYILNFNDAHDSKLDLSVKMLYAYMLPSNTTLANGDVMETEGITSSRIVLGARYKRNITTNTNSSNNNNSNSNYNNSNNSNSNHNNRYRNNNSNSNYNNSNNNSNSNSKNSISPNKYIWSYIVGLGYEYEAGGDTNVYLTTTHPEDNPVNPDYNKTIKLKVDTPSLKGSTFKLNGDINLDYNDYLTFGIGAEGFIGVRNGVEGNIAVKYMFGSVGREPERPTECNKGDNKNEVKKKGKCVRCKEGEVANYKTNTCEKCKVGEIANIYTNTCIKCKTDETINYNTNTCEKVFFEEGGEMILYGNYTPLQRKDKIQYRLLDLLMIRDKDCNMSINDVNGRGNSKGNSKGSNENNGNNGNSNTSKKQYKQPKQYKQSKPYSKLCRSTRIDVINISKITDIKKTAQELSIVEVNAITFMNMELTMDRFEFNKVNLNDSHRKYVNYIFTNNICALVGDSGSGSGGNGSGGSGNGGGGSSSENGSVNSKGSKTTYKANYKATYKGCNNTKFLDKDKYNKEKDNNRQNKYNDFTIILTGHGDRIGSDEANKKIGRGRAEEVKKEFIKLGVPANKILIGTFGKIYPVFESEELRDRSRRVDVWVRKKR